MVLPLLFSWLAPQLLGLSGTGAMAASAVTDAGGADGEPGPARWPLAAEEGKRPDNGLHGAGHGGGHPRIRDETRLAGAS